MVTRHKVHCLGKLPVHGDFVRMHAGVPELAALDRWLQEGLPLAMRSLGRHADQGLAEAAHQSFVFGSFAGVWRPSRDKVGRRFPLLIGSRLEPDPTSEDLVRLPFELADAAAEWLGFADREWGELREFQAMLELRYWQRDSAAATADRSESLGRPASSMWVGCLGSAATLAHRARLLADLHEVTAIADDRQPANGRFVVRIPCSNEPADVAFWLELVAIWRRQEQFQPTFATWGAGSLSLLFEPLHAKYFEALHWPDREHANRYDLGGVVAAEVSADERTLLAMERFGDIVADDRPVSAICTQAALA